ncbi:Peptidyl-prolyl cis-trans isomerase D [Fundidesulfovibrio magnetotacticus]|uniref:Periplasmic chaperone PpiD n=1 Tax=Fundidesulfovibrio magnetotacticus TaxID=2730080 RepID=A0A6V8LU58_9BACT|nr:peptidylprolyl isomerase [Fundidesulfovibrio magnetotacticus]GFK94121.1 Peptidyl-prolyl cis-trans isomerase D [Fundidesulfovibrio magnetotacticus]
MLDFLRQHSQSWVIKVIFGLIIAVFVFFGVYTFQAKQPGGGVLAYVGDTPILTKEFFEEYEGFVRQVQAQNPGMGKDDLERLGFKRQVFSQMVLRQLLFNQAGVLGVNVSPAELQAEIARVPAFQNDQGKFDYDLYKEKLKSIGVNPEMFEAEQRRDLLLEKMMVYVTQPVYVAEPEIRALYNFSQEKAVLDYLAFPAKDFAAQVTVTPEQVKAAYEATREKYKRPAEVKIEYVEITPASLADPKAVTVEEVKAYYDANPDKFKHPEMVKANHLLVLLAPDAPEAQVKAAEKRLLDLAARLKKGEAFDKVLAVKGDPAVNGDDLGWFPKGAMVPEFEQAAFALKKGDISGLVRTQFGLHVIQVMDKKAEGVTSLEEASDDIRRELAEDKAAETIGKTVDAMLEELIGGAAPSKLAQAKGLEAKTSEFFNRQRPPLDLNLSTESLNALFAQQAGKAVPQALAAGEGYVLAKVLEAKPENIPPLDEVADAVKADLVEQEALKLAEAKAKETAALLATPEGQAKVADQYKSAFSTTPPFPRSGPAQGLGQSTAILEAAFTAKEPGWLPGTYAVPGAFVIAKLKDRAAPPDADWQRDKAKVMNQALSFQREQLLRAYLAYLNEKTPEKIVAPEILGPVGIQGGGMKVGG